MSKHDDTFEMLEDSIITPKRPKSFYLIMVGILVFGGLSIFALKQMNLPPPGVPSLDETVQNEVPALTVTPPTKAAIPEPLEITVFFGAASANIQPAELAKIEDFYQQIKDTPGTVHISGHTDDVGPDDGMFLSQQRANHVYSSLQSLRQDGRFTIIVEAFGDTIPIGDNATMEGRQQNRRVELEYTPHQP